MDPRRLETFRVVAQSGQVSSAARQLHVSQPTVTGQIRQLEASVGRALFERTARGMQLNEAGRALLVFAEQHAALLEAAQRAVETQKEPRGQLIIAASKTTAAVVLPELIAEFVRLHPRVGVRLEVENTKQVLEAVRSGRAPVGVVEGYARAPGLHLERFLDDELVPVIGADAEAPRSLDGQRIIWREVGSGTRAVIERALRRAGIQRKPRETDLEVGSNEAIVRLVERGVGLAFLSRFSAEASLMAGRVRQVDIARLRVTRTFSFVTVGTEVGGLASRFLSFARRR